MVGSLGSFSDKDVAVVGLGKSNQALARYLTKEGARITCFDRKTELELGGAYGELSSLGVSWSLGEGYLRPLPGFSTIFLTPGMKKSLPEIAEARRRNALITTETALFLDRCAARVCGITGSAGKTTTSTLLGLMLRESLPCTEVHVGGNIGSVLIEGVDSIPPQALVVLELSSFQLQLASKSPEVAVLLNVRPNHLDIHDSFDEYVSAKEKIFKNQTSGDLCVLNLDDPLTRAMASECKGRVAFFTLQPQAAERQVAKGSAVAWLQDSELLYSSGDAVVHLARADQFLVPGRHNIANALAASLGALALGATAAGISRAIASFRGVEHRIEFVRDVGGVRYYNDSIATSPDRTEAMLSAIPGPLTLVLGGYDKGIPFDGLAEMLSDRDCLVITIGKTAPIIEDAITRAQGTKADHAPGSGTAGVQVVRAASLEEAVRLAAQRSTPGTSVVLSPACASYDMFANFEERGRSFKDLVKKLK